MARGVYAQIRQSKFIVRCEELWHGKTKPPPTHNETNEAHNLLRELLRLVPGLKILYSAGAFDIPELHSLDAVSGHHALGPVLEEFVREGLIDA